jgi:hypothetical protein
MKYLKTYENNNETFWVYTEISSQTPQVLDIQLFSDKESAENYFITKMNSLSETPIYTLEDADEFRYDNEMCVEYNEVINKGRFELPEEFKLERDSKKYNL